MRGHRAAVGAGEDLFVFVAFAGDDDDVGVGVGLWRAGFDRCSDGAGAVDLDVYFVAEGFVDAGEDVFDDRGGFFGARVVAGDDDVVGELCGGFAHAGAFGFVAVAAAAEDDEEFAGAFC